MNLDLVKDIKGRIESILQKYDGESLHLMVSGGSVIRLLGRCDFSAMDTTKWHVFFSDERCDPEHRNFLSGHEFLSRISGQAHPISIEEDQKNSSSAYEETLRCYMRIQVPVIDVCLLGIGPDGHTCSLWPGSPALDSADLVTFVTVPTSQVPKRITVTPLFLNEQVQQLFFVVPLKQGMSQNVLEPHEEIRKKLKKEYTVIVEHSQH